MSSTATVPHTATWDYLISRLRDRFGRSPKEVKEAIMTDIDDLIQEFWRTSSDVEVSFFAMRRLLEILQECFDDFDVCFDITSVSATAVDLADKFCRWQIPWTTKSESNLRYWLMDIEICLISHFLNPKIWVTFSCFYLIS